MSKGQRYIFSEQEATRNLVALMGLLPFNGGNVGTSVGMVYLIFPQYLLFSLQCCNGSPQGCASDERVVVTAAHVEQAYKQKNCHITWF